MNNIFDIENSVNFHSIDNYLYDKLSTTEKAAFEAELANNEELQAELQRQKLEHLAIKELAKAQLRANMLQWSAENVTTQEISEKKPEARVVQMPQRFTMRWAAAAAIISVMLFGTYWANTNYSDASLALAYTDDISSGQTKGSANNSTAEELLITAKHDMLKGNEKWTDALAKLNQINESSLTEEVALLQARCYTGLKDYNKAIPAYQNIISNMPSQKQNAEWNLLLTYIAAGNHTNEVDKLSKEILANPSHEYSASMQKLDAQLHSIWRKLVF